jgi:hypothetical protein
MMNKYLKNALLMTASLVLLLTLGVPALNSTPDGETPADESICDSLQSATPGLYGLCVAYCEAQDCDLEGVRSGQCSAPNPKLLDVYDKKRRIGDPPMPCVAPESDCPCFGPEDLRVVTLDLCIEGYAGDYAALVLRESSNRAGDEEPSWVYIEESPDDGSGRCVYRDASDLSNPQQYDFATDPDETSACLRLAEDYLEETDIACTWWESD